MKRLAAGLVLALLGAQACSDSPAGPPLSVEASGSVRGLVYVDQNGNGTIEATDVPAKGWTVSLFGGNGALLTATQTDSSGVFRVFNVPVGRVHVEIDAQRLGDSLQIFSVSGAGVTLALGDTAQVIMGLTYPRVPIDSVAAVPVGRKIFVDGTTLNGLIVGGPRELHLRGRGVVLRTVDLDRQAIGAGDSVRVLGRRAVSVGRPILSESRVFLMRAALDLPQPITLNTGNAATAQGGTVPFELVRVRTATIAKVRNDQDDVVLTVDDGSGALEILLRAFLAADSSAFDPALLRLRDATGLLLPYLDDTGATRWRLAPRVGSDIHTELIPIPPPAIR